MKIVKIFGLVIAAHVVAFAIFLLAGSGCQSSPRQRAEALEQQEAAAQPIVDENWSSQGGGAAAPDYASAGMEPVGAPLTGPTPAERMRSAPMRPENENAFISTSTPDVLAPPPPPPPPPAQHTVMSGESLWSIAHKYGLTVAQLTKANPKLKGNIHPGDVIKLPPGVGVTPSEAGIGTTAASRVTSAAATSTYVVRPGDSLSKIASRNATTVAALREANGIKGDVIQAGQTLVIPAGATDADMQPTGGSVPGGVQGMRVKVASGETLGVIAKRYSVGVQELMNANGITDARKVRAGQEIVIPGYQAFGSGVVPPTTPPPQPQPRVTQPAPVPVSTPPVQTPQPAPVLNPAPAPVETPADAVEAPMVPVDGDPTPQP